MTSDRTTRQIERLLDEAEQAITQRDWTLVLEIARDILALDPDSADGRSFLSAAERRLAGAGGTGGTAAPTQETVSDPGPPQPAAPAPAPAFFANGRYTVKRFLGEGGKKRVYLAHDTTLARDVAFALIKTDGLDLEGRERITREAQAMGKLGTHPHVVSVFDMGSEGYSPYLVTELMQGGDIEGLLEKASDHRLGIPDAVSLAVQVCRGLEFAHSHGLVHRDLKPGNVWLTADGIAKIGDFGLAVSLDRSRLTRAGMMVGTVSYMPPEQAMGGEVSPRSDLYSLGAMLYEMVTGRPPFVGEESVAIITQHLNVPPVSPTWHRPDCPPGLEALILRLLEKDAAKRPAAAGEVRQALEALGRGVASVTGEAAAAVQAETQAAAANDNPLYRRTFVGREQELRQLQAAFDGAVSGNGALVMVVGEPGIGKTALCEQLATYVTVRGGKTLVGHCYEEGSLTLPYLPFVEAIRSYVLARAPEQLKQDLGSAGADLARIVSELRDRIQVEVRPAGDPEDDRWRLYQAVTAFLRNASAVQPLFILLEDLHWADRGTMDLLVHLARNLSGARLVLLGTYRDVEVDRSHPLSGTLAELRRGAAFARIPLRGLTVDEVHRMMCQLRGQDVPWSRAEAIHRQTEGNPLFIQEVLRYLVEEGLVVREGGRWVRSDDGGADAGIPEGLRDVIGKRLSRLGERTNQVLAIASVLGRDFRLDVLRLMAGLSEEELVTAMEEATQRAVVEERAGLGAAVSYRFTHAFFRQTLYEEISAPRRIRWHQLAARALEEIHGRRLEDHAPELAEHFAHSSDREDLKKAVEYGELAARRAVSVYAHGEAVRHLEQALEVQEVLDPADTAKRCDLLLALADAQLPLGNPGRVWNDVVGESLKLAEGLQDDARASRACTQALEALHRDFAAYAPQQPAWRLWAEAADRHAKPGSVDRVHADLALGRLRFVEGRGEEGHQLIDRALEEARGLDDREALFSAARLAILYSAFGFRPGGWRRGLELAEEFSRVPWDGVSGRTQSMIAEFSGGFLLMGGRRDEFDRLWGLLGQVAQRTRDAFSLVLPISLEPVQHTLDGRLEEAVEAMERMDRLAEELGVVEMARVFRGRALQAQLWLGRFQEAPDVSGPPARQAIGLGRNALVLAHAGDDARAEEELRAALEAQPDSITQRWLLEAAILLEARDVLPGLMESLAQEPPITPGRGTMSLLGRLLGDASLLLDRTEAALGYYEEALAFARRIRFRPEVAEVRLRIAELLLKHHPDRQSEALEHLDFAIGEFRAMKMQPALERALKHKGLLHA